MNKDAWDKVSVIATFIQIVVIGGFTVLVSFYTARMSNKLDMYKSGLDENEMIAKLVTELTNDTTSTLKTDFALLSLERYLKSSQQGELKIYDKEMLTGFAQSIILNRFLNTSKANTDTGLNQIFIESKFLQKTDSVAYVNVLAIISNGQKRTEYPKQVIGDVAALQPINQVTDEANTQAISLLFNKTCYIQYASPALKSKAEDIRKVLLTKKWYAPGLEYVAGSYKNYVKYFHAEDADLANNVRDIAGNNTSTILIQGFQSKIPKGQLEIWIGN